MGRQLKAAAPAGRGPGRSPLSYNAFFRTHSLIRVYGG